MDTEIVRFALQTGYMKLIRISRKTQLEKRYSPKMGVLQTRVTYIRKKLLGLTFKTLHSYRETYYGEVKECADCRLQH